MHYPTPKPALQGRTSNAPQVPRLEGSTLLTVVCTCAPVTLATRCRSSSATRPAQKISRSAKYCVARSPIGSLDRTTCRADVQRTFRSLPRQASAGGLPTFAPVLTQFSSFS
eukprot:scaffold152_cov383-Prasinococcus_capsulatus_cf.AAC.12